MKAWLERIAGFMIGWAVIHLWGLQGVILFSGIFLLIFAATYHNDRKS
jgi:hypothetical protein